MSKKIAINGFGRIGRNAFKLAFERSDIEIAAINDLTDTKTLAYLLKHDSTYGNYHREVSFNENSIIVDGKEIRANFYKCGDELDKPHYLSWNPINLEKPNFHCPEFFGTLFFE